MIDPLVALMRQDVLREMPDVVTIRRQSGFTLNPTTLVQEPTFTAVAVGVRASVVRKSNRLVQQGDGGYDVETYAVHIPTCGGGGADG
jgi:hypothetical protein